MKNHLWARAVTHCWHSACLACREPWVTPSTADPGHGGATGTWRQSQTFKTAFSYIASLDSVRLSTKINTKLKASKKISKSDNLSLTPGTHCGRDSVVLLCTTAHVHTHTRAHTRINFFLIEQNAWNLDCLENDDGETCSHLAILQGTGRCTINSVMDFNYFGVRGKKNQSFDKSKLGVERQLCW